METSEILNTTPTEVIAGSTAEWSLSLPHTPADGFTCKFRLAGASNAVTITATPSDDNESYDLRLAPANTTGFATGIYNYQVTTEDGTDIFVEIEGQLAINALVSGVADGRSVHQKIVDAIDALMLARATSDQQAYQIGNRQLSRIPLPELKSMRQYYAGLIDQEYRAARLKAGKSLWPAIRVTFT